MTFSCRIRNLIGFECLHCRRWVCLPRSLVHTLSDQLPENYVRQWVRFCMRCILSRYLCETQCEIKTTTLYRCVHSPFEEWKGKDFDFAYMSGNVRMYVREKRSAGVGGVAVAGGGWRGGLLTVVITVTHPDCRGKRIPDFSLRWATLTVCLTSPKTPSPPRSCPTLKWCTSGFSRRRETALITVFPREICLFLFSELHISFFS